jgi:hypothetical protein
MKPTLTADPAALLLVDIVKLKWLLAGHGIYLHVERMQTDADYAGQLLQQAAAHPALRQAAQRLRQGLGIP